MSENEPSRGSRPIDVTQKFLDSSPSEFREYLLSLGPTRVVLNMEIKDAPEPSALSQLILSTQEQISEVKIRANSEEHDEYPELFDIPGVIWEKI